MINWKNIYILGLEKKDKNSYKSTSKSSMERRTEKRANEVNREFTRTRTGLPPQEHLGGSVIKCVCLSAQVMITAS